MSDYRTEPTARERYRENARTGVAEARAALAEARRDGPDDHCGGCDCRQCEGEWWGFRNVVDTGELP